MIEERRQFRILYRDFLLRMVDLELLSAQGDIYKLFGQFAALLAAFSFVLAILFVPRYTSSTLPPQRLLLAAWGDEEFLIATTIAVVGLFSVIAWNAVLPDRRDSFVLGLLPVRTRTMCAARVAAIATAIAVCVAAVNIFTGLSYPFLVTSANAGVPGAIRSFGAYWTTMFAAGSFVSCAFLALQGVAAQLLTYRLFLRVSGFLQLTALFVTLAVYFLTPPLANVRGITSPANQNFLAWLPSFWFLGLFQWLNGATHPAFGPLAARAFRNLLIAVAIALLTYTITYYRNIRRIVEQPDIVPANRSRPANRITSFLASRILSRPLDRAIVLFTMRSIARSRQHRLLLAAYIGAGLAIALAYAKSLLYGYSSAPWYQLNSPLLVAGIVVLSLAVIGARAVFAFPLTLPANWIFRITGVHRPAAYFAAVRKSLYIVAAIPVWILCAVLYFAIWSGLPAFAHMLILLAIGIILVEKSLYQFRKIPFACSYLPGNANINVRLGVYGIAFLFVAEVGVQIEFWAMHRLARFIVLIGILIVAAVWARRRTSEFAAAPYNRIQFEALPPAEVFALDLRSDGAWSNDEAYVDAIDPHFGRSLGARLRPIAIAALILLACGFAYERVGAWRDQKRFPQMGRSFDVGGRSLNISCAGTGSPTVILEGNWGTPGYAWVSIQREIAKFTRACWYDRAGYGWSDPRPFPNHSDSIARDLHKLLQVAEIPPPYVLVGHSMGGFHVRVFNGFYRGEVAGMVLVDPMNEDMTIRIHNHIESLRPGLILVFEILGRLGWWRLLARDPGAPPRGLTPWEWATISALRSQAKSMATQPKEPPMWVNGEMARSSGGFGNIPLAVLSAGKQEEEEDAKLENQPLKWALHAKLAALSTRGKQVIVPNSGHHIPTDAPEAVIEAVQEVVSEARR